MRDICGGGNGKRPYLRWYRPGLFAIYYLPSSNLLFTSPGLFAGVSPPQRHCWRMEKAGRISFRQQTETSHQATLERTKNCQHASNCWSKSTKVWCESSLAMQNCVNSILQKQYHMTWNSIRCYIWCIGQGLLCLYSPIISQFWWLDLLLSFLSAIGHFYIGLVSSKTGRCRGNFNCIDFCDFPTDLGFAFNSSWNGIGLGIGCKLCSKYRNHDWVISISTPFLPNHGWYHGNSQLWTCHSHLKM